MISDKLDFFRNIGVRIFWPVSKFLASIGVTANKMTLVSFLMGIASVIFLFKNNWLFVLFAALHLLCDVLDGEIARFTKKATNYGVWLDHCADMFITLLLLGKTYFYIGQFEIPLLLYWSVVVLYAVHNLIFIISKRTLSMIYSRTLILILFAFGFVMYAYYLILIVNALGIAFQLWYFAAYMAPKKRRK
jgi:phosphatidylglycerophosphate synthase